VVVVEQIDEEDEAIASKLCVGGDEATGDDAAGDEGAMAIVVVCDPELASALLLTPSQLPGEAGELELMEPPY